MKDFLLSERASYIPDPRDEWGDEPSWWPLVCRVTPLALVALWAAAIALFVGGGQ